MWFWKKTTKIEHIHTWDKWKIVHQQDNNHYWISTDEGAPYKRTRTILQQRTCMDCGFTETDRQNFVI